jgi:hypothetical protein
MADDPVPGTDPIELRFRDSLAKQVFWISVGALAMLGSVALIGASKLDSDHFAGGAKDILALLLPVLGTWVGTVLAFYFGNQNFITAHRAALETLQATGAVDLSTKAVGDVMRLRGNIVAMTVPAGGLGSVKLADIDAKLNSATPDGSTASRLPFFDAESKAVAMIHAATWSQMILAGQKATPPVNVATDTLDKLLPLDFPSKAGKTFQNFVTGTLAFVGIDRSLADAKAAMEAKPGCQDVMVTKTGSIKEPVLGWITNVDIGRLSTAS